MLLILKKRRPCVACWTCGWRIVISPCRKAC